VKQALAKNWWPEPFIARDALGDLQSTLFVPRTTAHDRGRAGSMEVCPSDLNIVSQTGGIVTVNVPGNSNIAPLGWYMLFLDKNKGVPSVARWIHLS
jgi:galactose oxidase-like protein